MTNIEYEYLQWLISKINFIGNTVNNDHAELLSCLFDIEFKYILILDGNRLSDGLNLRPEFAYETGRNKQEVINLLSHRKCSYLEMMVGLAIRMERDIMIDDDKGDRTGKWFWIMIHSLGLYGMNNYNFNRNKVIETMHRCTNHNYAPNGKGGLFTVENTTKDIRTMDIWLQMQHYLMSLS